MEMLNIVGHGDEQDIALNTSQTPPRRVGVVVLGMHRSGSSAITRMFNLLGCSLPKTLMPADVGNWQGHWESTAVADLNDEILAEAGTSWDDWLPVNSRLSETVSWPELVARGGELLHQEFADAPLFVLKDPRICKLAGFWTEVLYAEGVDPAFVLPLRNPLEVARSLAVRNGIDEHSGLLIWLRHVLTAEATSRGRPRVFTDYSSLLDNWVAIAAKTSDQLGLVWPRLSMLSSFEISQFLTPDSRHHFSQTSDVIDSPSVPPWIAKTYEILLGWAQRGESAEDYPALEAILHAFDQAGPAFAGPLRHAASLEQRVAQVEAQRAVLAEERDRITQRLAEVEAGVAAATQQHIAFAQERNTVGRRNGEGEVEFALAHGGIDDLPHHVAVTESTLRQREEEIARVDR